MSSHTRMTLKTEIITKPRELLRDLNNIHWLTNDERRALAEVIRPHLKVVQCVQLVSDEAKWFGGEEEYTDMVWKAMHHHLLEGLAKEIVPVRSEEPM